MKLKLLIIGKTGQLGSALVEDVKLLNYDVIATGRDILDITKVKVEDKFERLLKNNNPDYVINCAAYNNVIECEHNQVFAFDVNCFAVKNVAEITNKLGIPFVTFSTDYVFDGKKNSQYVETDMPHPINVYGLSKLSGEYAALIYENTVVIRTCGLYGLHSESTKNGKGNFIDNRIKDSTLSILHENKNVQVEVGCEVGCDQTVSPTFANDLSKAVMQLVDHPSEPLKKGGIYHLVNEGYCTWYELTKEVYNILNIDTKLIPVDRHGTDGLMRRPLFSALKNERSRKLGIMLPHWKDALRRYLKMKYGNEVST